MPPTQPAPPYYDPTLLAQIGPVSGPYGAVPVMAAPRSSRVTVTVLSAVLGVFVLVSGVVGALFVRENTASNKQADEIATLEDRVDDLQRELDTTKRDLGDAEDDLNQATDDRDKVAACLEAVLDWLSTDVGSAEEATAEQTASDRCREAGY